MSTTLPTSTMVSQIQAQLPIGLSSTFCMDRLNEAYRWVTQRCPMTWLIKSTTVLVGTAGTFPCPTDYDVGRLAVLSGTVTLNNQQEIPFTPWDRIQKYQYSDLVVAKGMYSVWSFYASPAPPPQFTGIVYPTIAAPAAGTHTLNFTYHALPGTPLTSGGATYFPSPDAFDSMIVALAIAEAKSPAWYGLSGWDVSQKAAQDSVLALVEQYRSTKNSLLGMVEQGKQAQEASTMRAEA